MDIDEDGVTDPTAEFGELFEGQVAFESELGDHDADEMLGAIGNTIAMGASAHHRASHLPSDHDILEANLPFVPDDYLQHQHIVIDSETSEYIGVIPDVSGLEDPQNQLNQLGAERAGPQIYIPASSSSHFEQTHPSIVTVSSIHQNFSEPVVAPVDQKPLRVIPTTVAPVINEGPKIKKRIKVLKNVKHYTDENMKKYLKRRGFKAKNGTDISAEPLSKAVFALSSNSHNSDLMQISFGSKYEADYVVPEIERFWKFYILAKAKSPLIAAELLPMLMPILLHFYFEMMLSNLYPVARRICLDFSKKFLHEDKTQEHYDVLVAAMKVTSAEMLKSDTILSPLLRRRCKFFLSEQTLLHLRRFLAKSSNPIFLNLFTSRFKIRTKEAKELMESFDWETVLDSDDETEESNSEDIADDNEADKKSERIEQLSTQTRNESNFVKGVIDQVRNSVLANLPSISIFTTSDDPVCGAMSRQGSLVAFGLLDSGIRLYSSEDAKNVLTVGAGSQPEEQNDSENLCGVKCIGGHDGTVYDLHFHPRTKLLFSAGQDGVMKVWDLNNSDVRCRAIYRGHIGPIWKLDMTESGSMIATAGLDTTARLYLPEKTEFVRIMAGHYFSVNTVKFHPNEAYIATGSADKSARLWSVNDGEIVRMYSGASGTVNCLAFHNSGKYLAGAGEGKKIIIWDIAEGEIIATLNCLQNCKDLVFCGSTLTACYRNGMLQIFNLRPLLGGDESKYEDTMPERALESSINSPFTTATTAKTLFKVYYTNPGTLYGLGSDIIQMENPIVSDDGTPSNSSQNDPVPVKKESDDMTSSSESTNTTLLQQVLQASIANTVVKTESQMTQPNVPSISNSTGSSKILAARLSQPPPVSSLLDASEDGDVTSMILSEGDDPPSVATPMSVATGSTPMISSSELDAAIASVIDQSGGDQSSGGGTITMYASSL